MNILHIIDHLGLGGAQTVVKGIFESQKNNKNIFLFALRKREINIKINHPNVKIYNSEGKYSLFPIKELRKIIKKNKIDFLHCHLFRSQFIGGIIKKKYFPKIKLIFHEHGEVFQKGKIYPYFMKRSRKEVDLFIAVSKATKNKLIERAKINSNKIKVLYNFVDLKKFNRKNVKIDINKEKAKLRIKKEDFVIGFVGRLSEVKGCEYLIKSLPYLNFKYKVLIAGEGPEKKILEKLAKKLKVINKIIFLGHIENIIFVYSVLDILIIPSLSESFGISVIEAQSLGIPVVASNIGGLKEIINNNNNNNNNNRNGLLFRLKNPKDIAKKIGLVYKNKDLKQKLIKKGIENTKRYSLRNYLVKLDKIYENVE